MILRLSNLNTLNQCCDAPFPGIDLLMAWCANPIWELSSPLCYYVDRQTMG